MNSILRLIFANSNGCLPKLPLTSVELMSIKCPVLGEVFPKQCASRTLSNPVKSGAVHPDCDQHHIHTLKTRRGEFGSVTSPMIGKSLSRENSAARVDFRVRAKTWSPSHSRLGRLVFPRIHIPRFPVSNRVSPAVRVQYGGIGANNGPVPRWNPICCHFVYARTESKWYNRQTHGCN